MNDEIKPPTVKPPTVMHFSDNFPPPVEGHEWFVAKTEPCDPDDYGYETVTTYLNADGRWRKTCYTSDDQVHGYYPSREAAEEALRKVAEK